MSLDELDVLLAVGHGVQPNGVWDPGAVSSDQRWNEQSAGDVFMDTAARFLRAVGAKRVRSEARSPSDPNWVGTARNANSWGVDLVVSGHHDWSKGVNGAHGFYHSKSSEGYRIGKAILESVEDAGFNVRWDWFRERPSLGLIKNTNAPAFLFEAGRIGDSTLDDVAELEKLGLALGRGIAAHYGVSPVLSGMTEDDVKGRDMGWLEQWKPHFRRWAADAESRGLITEDTDPNEKVGDMTVDRFLVLRDRASDDLLGRVRKEMGK